MQHRPEPPEPFRRALAGGDLKAVVDYPASAPAERFARGLVRLRVGEDAGAREDFVAARPEFEDSCALELALLDIRLHDVRGAEQAACRVLSRQAPDSYLAARAKHVLGLACSKLRLTDEAVALLVAAQHLYISLRHEDLAAQAEDTLGMVFASRGQLGLALTYYSLSLAHKTLCEDRYGIAITLGNMGRIHLSAGRHTEALACFQADLQMAPDDQRGRARVLNDMARVELERGDADRALALLTECHELSERNGYADVHFFVHMDRGRAHVRRREFDEARRMLERAGALLSDTAETYVGAHLSRAWAEYHLALGSDADAAVAIEHLLSAVAGYAETWLPDHEIPTLVLLAQAYSERGHKAHAIDALRGAINLARGDGMERYRAPIREVMMLLALSEGVADERDRPFLTTADDYRAREASSAYVKLRRLGGGDFGDVFHAFDAEHNREVAIKFIRQNRDQSERRLATLRREYEAVSEIVHPGIARVHAVGRDPDGKAYVVQELVDGTSLREVLPGTPRDPLEVILATVVRIAMVLEYLHDRGVVHRDLKPENIMLRRGDLHPVLVDFGIAQVVDHDAELAGTLPYMAPEQFDNRRVDGAADIYALGVVLYEWLTGRRPLPREAGGELSRETVQKETPRPIAEFRPDAPEVLVSLVEHMLDKDPNRRPSVETVQRTGLEIFDALNRGEPLTL